jgi:hypothetical protein
MDKRIKLGLVFKYDESWVAGSYYILNLLQALKTLPTENSLKLYCLPIELKIKKRLKK